MITQTSQTGVLQINNYSCNNFSQTDNFDCRLRKRSGFKITLESTCVRDGFQKIPLSGRETGFL